MSAALDKLTADPATLEEIAFLRFFFQRAGNGMGPADGDIYRMIMEDFELLTGARIPASLREGYFDEEYEEEEDNAE